MSLNPADPAFIQQLASQVPDDCLSPPDARYLEEPRGRYQGQGGVLARPRDVSEVQTIIKACRAARVGVVPYGGGTGLVGGQLTPEGPAPVILSLERMNRVRDVFPQENALVVEAGVILADVQVAAEQAERLFPLSLASEGSAQIGGNLSANAGGTGVLRYGNARDLCLGVEAVLPDGSVLNGLSRLRKDNTGYDLRHLLIGAEGTLGVITAATLKLFARPAVTAVALLYVPSPDAALSLLSLVRDQVGEAVSAFELIHQMGFHFLSEAMPELRQPFDSPPEWCVLLELGLPAGSDGEAMLAQLFEAGAQAELVSDGILAQSQTQATALWALRESIPEANRRIGSISSHDISLPMGTIPDFIAKAPDVIARIGDFRINCFGHLGDGNLHYNVFPQTGDSRDRHVQVRGAIKRAVHDLVHEMGGSVSAEHGIGRLKVDDLTRYSDPAKLATMRAIKAAIDPVGIMNPGAMLSATLPQLFASSTKWHL